jgi:hypothetical protein
MELAKKINPARAKSSIQSESSKGNTKTNPHKPETSENMENELIKIVCMLSFMGVRFKK